MLATDLAAVSQHAADHAIALAIEEGAELIVLSVVDPNRLLSPGGLFLRRIDQERSRVEAKAQALALRARAAGVPATFLVWEGDPAETILSASESENVDVIVLGSHDRGPTGTARPRQHLGTGLEGGPLSRSRGPARADRGGQLIARDRSKGLQAKPR